MKTAQEFSSGNIIKMGNDVFFILKATFNKSGRNAAVMKFKLKNVITGQIKEEVVKAGDKFDDIRLDKKAMQFLYEMDGDYNFMDQETFDQIALRKEDLEDAPKYLVEEMVIDVLFYEGKPVGIELPTTVEREVTYTEPGLRGDTTGKVMKPATIETGYELQVPLFVNIGDVIKIDTRNGEYVERVNK
ncbi:MAG: translation elongation factor [Fusobacteriales bacterium]|jgi:elongation factor P|nr:translation elongation factor [Fusobacteriales bacterium]